MKKEHIHSVFKRLSQKNPEPKTELIYKNHFTLLVAVVLSAQATDVGVNKATPALFELADTPEKMLALGEERLRDLVKTIGLFRSKAKNIITLSKQLIEHHDSQVPEDFDALCQLAGVGRKTANVIMNCAFNHPTIAVDTHVHRVSNRIGLVNTTTPEKTEFALEKVIPKAWKQHAHHWLILHGRYVCKARKPDCGNCIIHDLCTYTNKI